MLHSLEKVKDIRKSYIKPRAKIQGSVSLSHPDIIYSTFFTDRWFKYIQRMVKKMNMHRDAEINSQKALPSFEARFFIFVFESRNFWAYADLADFEFWNVRKKSKWEAVPETADPFPSKGPFHSSSAVVLSTKGNLHTFNSERVQKTNQNASLV